MGENKKYSCQACFLSIVLLFLLTETHGFALENEATLKVPVKVFTAEQRDLSATVSAMGTLTYLTKAEVSSEIDGILSSVMVEEGDRVEKGEVIAQIDTAFLNAQLRQAKAVLEMAEINLIQSENDLKKSASKLETSEFEMKKSESIYQSQKKLFDIGAIKQSDFYGSEINYQRAISAYKSALADYGSLQATSESGRNEAQVRVIKAKADLDAIQVQLDKCTIRATLSGIVVAKRKWTGESIRSGDSAIVTILQTDQIYVEADLNEKNAGDLKIGQTAVVSVDAFPDLSLSGKVAMIAPTIDLNNRTIKVKVKLNNEQKLLKPGMFARLNIVLESIHGAVAIPEEAIMTAKDGRQGVFVVLEEVAFFRDVQTGVKKDGWVVIEKGVRVGERVVVEGQENLRDLMAVRSTETAQP